MGEAEVEDMLAQGCRLGVDLSLVGLVVVEENLWRRTIGPNCPAKLVVCFLEEDLVEGVSSYLGADEVGL